MKGLVILLIPIYFYFTYLNLKNANKKKVKDIFLNNTPNLEKYSYITDIIIYMDFTIILFDKKNDILGFLDTYCFIITIIFTIRFLTVNMTILPTINSKPFLKWKFGYPNFCNDYIFSGHTSQNVLMLLLCDNIYLKSLLFINLIILSSLLILTRMHYTIDIFLGYIITHYVFLLSK